MYRYTYLGYACGKNVSVAESEQVYFSLVGSFDQMTFIYLETPVRDLDPDTVVKGDFIPFPDGRRLARMEQIFYCDDWHDDAVLTIPPERTQALHEDYALEPRCWCAGLYRSSLCAAGGRKGNVGSLLQHL